MPLPLPPLAPAPRLSRPDYLRDPMQRGDRLPNDEQVDRPEIEESFRVTLSDEAIAEAVAGPPDSLRRRAESAASPFAARALAAYASVAQG